MSDITLNFEYNKGVKEVYPANNLAKNWRFDEGEEDEASLAHFMAVVAEKNGLSGNDLNHIFPVVLRILKSEIPWSK